MGNLSRRAALGAFTAAAAGLGVSAAYIRGGRRAALARPEQQLLGIMYNGIIKTPVPLVVRESRHWLWPGTGLQDGDRLAGVAGGEADGFIASSPPAAGELTLLAASPYALKAGGSGVQNTSLLQMSSGRDRLRRRVDDLAAEAGRTGSCRETHSGNDG